MKQLKTSVVVIGGGVTGAGVLRDLTMRGFDCVLIEQKDLVHGTSSRNHGLLHSGARYAVRDKDAAMESYRENLILKHIAKGSVEETGGLFVKVPGDDDSYVDEWVKSCLQTGIPIEEISLTQALKEEPFINPEAEAIYRVPDGAVDPFTLVIDTVEDAVLKGATCLRYHEVKAIHEENGQITGVTAIDRYTNESVNIQTDFVVNAAGPWGERVTSLAGIEMKLINNKGTLTVLNQRINHQVINRLRMPGDADIFVPARDVTIFGTTGVNVKSPDDFSLNKEEISRMLEEGAALIPDVRKLRTIRAFSGSRPLFQEEGTNDASGRNVTRGMALIDHEERDGLKGFITITGGKLTTFRYMAEKTVDLVCEKTNQSVQCTTGQVPMHERKGELSNTLSKAADKKIATWSGIRKQAIEEQLKTARGSTIICECEQVTWAEVKASMPADQPFHLGDIRRRTRLGMGPCQGTYCHKRAAALAVEDGLASAEEAETAIMEALESRKKGMQMVDDPEAPKQKEVMNAIYHISLGIPEGGKINV
ncbi:anaerobic glycerol-3-phosphate dehydrogenase subunit GlpA [Salisediminibacterium beveridgei]|uniref:Aerobic glycerol-3-phosphate dehydrogenase n=1 Tax=Salisediminibacterium beveridgei TaxID=632773 RepID=A0A1D7QVA0_9BACI|nr:anaerobic glycerol-3-phosphate dehydrogenase subunit GlpA [Salisediminibacterium beveridgei]AOM82944.1 Anaerobic glycerol-3-phosphate dehydrogenase subunit A [Salisediminibacterium beveridgei]